MFSAVCWGREFGVESGDAPLEEISLAREFGGSQWALIRNAIEVHKYQLLTLSKGFAPMSIHMERIIRNVGEGG